MTPPLELTAFPAHGGHGRSGDEPGDDQVPEPDQQGDENADQDERSEQSGQDDEARVKSAVARDASKLSEQQPIHNWENSVNRGVGG